MSIALSSDPIANGGSRLYWLTDDGRVMASDGAVRGSEERRWKGLAAQKDRVLLWDETRVAILEVRSDEATRTHDLEGRVEHAGWAGPAEPDVYEVCHHETSGHPTDRIGFRVRRDARHPELDGESLAQRQGRAPPWGAEGFWADQDDVCSEPVGRVLETHQRGGPLVRFAKTGSRGRVQLPDAALKCSRFFVVSGPRGVVVAGADGAKLSLFAVLPRGTAKRRPFKWKAPARVRDVVTHDGSIVVAVQGHDPVVVPDAYDALA